jgi:hypothetical protein
VICLTTTLGSAAESPVAVVARPADAFVDSIGLNGLGGPYIVPYGDARKSLYNTSPASPEYIMGVRYARYEIRPGTDMGPLIQIAKQGIRIDALVSWLWTDPAINPDHQIADVLPLLHQLPDKSIATIEGNNESDMPEISGDFPRYKASTEEAHTNQTALYQAVKADPKLKDVPVIAWTLGKNWPWGGNIGYGKFTSTDFDYQSLHCYPGNDTIAGSMFAPGHNQYMKLTNSILPPGEKSKPVVVTETGSTYSVTGPDKVEHNSELAQAKKTTIILAESFRMGFIRTYLYSVGGQKPFSLDTRDDGTPRPAGTALSFLTSTLGEAKWNPDTFDWEAPKFDPGSLSFSLSGGPDSVHSILLEKSDHSFYLLIWNDLKVWNEKENKDLENPSANVVMNIESTVPMASAETLTLQADGTYSSQPARLEGSGTQQSLNLAVPDSLMLVHLVPSF